MPRTKSSPRSMRWFHLMQRFRQTGRVCPEYVHYNPDDPPSSVKLPLLLNLDKKADPDTHIPMQLPRFKTLPVDIAFEVAYHLEPTDLLSLSRASKNFRKIFMSRRAKHIWTNAFVNVGLPACPCDLSEPQYASLVFEKHCTSCFTGKREIVTDFALKLRLCSACRKLKLRKLPAIISSADLGLPHERLLQHLQPWTGTHHYPNVYYVPYVTETLEVASSLCDGPTLDDSIEKQKHRKSAAHKFAAAMHDWKSLRMRQIVDNATTSMWIFRKTAETKLEEIGYRKSDFPTTFSPMYKSWLKLVCQDKDMTSQIWNDLRPKLEKIALAAQEYARQTESTKFYAHSLLSNSRIPGKCVAMGVCDLLKLPCIRTLFEGSNVAVEITRERWETLEIPEQLAVESVQYEARAHSHLSDQLQQDPRYPQSLDCATSFFRCNKDVPTGCLQYPDILFHRSLTCLGTIKRNRTDCHLSDIIFATDAADIASSLLDSLGLPLSTSMANMSGHGNTFECLTCNEGRQLTWIELVNHVYTMTQTAATRARKAHKTRLDHLSPKARLIDMSAPQGGWPSA